ncbi:MAG: chemotaxis protein CheW [Methylomicrobium sp.]
MNAVLAERETGPVDTLISQAFSSSDAPPNEAVQEIQRFGFRIGPLGFLFPENCPGEIVTAPQTCRIPHTHDWMVGVTMLRGHLIPVFDLHRLFFETQSAVYKPMVLILGQGKRALGFVLQDPPQWLAGLTEAPAASVPIPDLLAAQVTRVYQQQDTNWLAFNESGFFTFLAENAKSC